MTHADLRFLDGNSALAKMFRAKEWSKHSLGPPEFWDPQLKTIVSLILNSSFPMFVTWGQDRIFLYNDKYAEIVGEKYQASLGQKFDVVWSDIWHDLLPLFLQVDRGESVFLEDMRFLINRSAKKNEKEEAYFTFSYSPIRGKNNGVDGLFCAVVETTKAVLTQREQVEARKKLQDSEENLKFAIESAKMGAWTIEFPSQRTLLSEQAREVFGFAREYQSSNDAIDSFIHPEDREKAKAHLAEALANKTAYRDELRIVRPNFEIRWIDTRGHAKYNQHGEPVSLSGIVIDITEQKHSEIALQVAKKEAERANDLKSAFLANMSHEIRTPLAAILGFSTLLRDKNLKDEETELYIETIARNSNSLTRIIDDILDLAKVEAGKLEIEEIPFSIGILTADVVDIFKDKILEKKIYLELTIDESVPPQICSDPTRLRQILVNLIGNAVKFTSTGGVRIQLSAFSLSNNQIQIRIDVKDTGIGITAEQKIKLFKPFMQADNSMTRKFGGTGLGLALSQRLAHALSGEITIAENSTDSSTNSSTDSSTNCGSTFSLTFVSSLSKEIPQIAQRIDNAKSPSPNALKDLKILVVDDSPDNQFLVARVLTKNGAQVQTAINGQEGLEKAIQGSFDLILMDIQMPVMDGYQAKLALDTRGILTPVIALTAHAMSDERIKTHSAGFVGHLTKPLNATELIRTVVHVSKM